MNRIMVQVIKLAFATLALGSIISSCKKDTAPNTGSSQNRFAFTKVSVNDTTTGNLTFFNVNLNPVIKFSFSSPIDTSSVSSSVYFVSGTTVLQSNFLYSNNDSTLIIQPMSA